MDEDGFIPFRYQGQYEDVETGLYYNRFRYYSPSDGCHIQPDPIGLAGGNPTLYAYVSDLNLKIDPFGLDDLYVLIANAAGWYDATAKYLENQKIRGYEQSKEHLPPGNKCRY